MKLLVIGGTHFIGREIVRVAVQAGHEVALFNRGQTDPDDLHSTIHGDVAHLVEFRDELRALQPDVVLHCIAYTEHDAANLVEVFAGTGAHLVVLGSQDCYAGFHQFRGERETTDFPIAEGAQLAEPYYWRGTQHSNAETYDKNRMADVLLRAHEAARVRATVLRLPMVYGPGDPQFEHRHGDIIRHVLDARPDFVMGHGEQGVIWTYGYITNVAAAVVHAAGRADVEGKIFNVGETTVRTRRRWADLYAGARSHVFRYRVVPDELLDTGQVRNRPTFHIITDNTAFENVTGFTPPISLENGIERTLAWATEHVDALGAQPNYDARLAAALRYDEFSLTL